jgi:S1-C subfamily serine protease
VSAGSPAEKSGIRIGDVIECLNGKCVSTVVEVSVLYIYYYKV